MTTQTQLSNPMEGVHEPVVKQQFSLPLALAILVLGFMVGVFATKLSSLENNSEVNRQRAIAAEAARYTSLGLFYDAGNEAQNEANVPRGLEAETARYNGLAKFYLTEDEVNAQRAIQAEAARYNALAGSYEAEDKSGSLVWPLRPVQFHLIEKGIAPIAENALIVYHQSEWGRIPNPVLPITENTLAAYHQSEWGRMPSTSLPIAEPKPNADQDIGLMEF